MKYICDECKFVYDFKHDGDFIQQKELRTICPCGKGKLRKKKRKELKNVKQNKIDKWDKRETERK